MKENIIKKVIAKVNQEKYLKDKIKELEQDLYHYQFEVFDDKNDYHYDDEENEKRYKDQKKVWHKFESSGKDLIKVLKNILSEKKFELLDSDKHLKKVMSILKEPFKNDLGTPYDDIKTLQAIDYWMEK